MIQKFLIQSLKLSMIVIVIAAASTVALADESSATVIDKGYICWAHGQQNFGGPAGPIMMTVVGYGATEFEAMSDAHQRCLSSGLQMCGIDACFKRR